MAKEIFDYSKISPSDYAYYGFHLKNGRYHIDTKRLKKLHCDAFPEALFNASRNTHYFTPKFKKASSYAVNKLVAQVNRLSSEWNQEYKAVINKIKTPKEVYDNVRLDGIAETSCSDDLEDIEVDAFIAGCRRQAKYDEVIKSIHLQYLQKTFTELFRTILLVIKERGYNDDIDFTYKKFFFHVQDTFKAETRKANPLYSLPHYKYFDLLNKIDNFLKHNTVMAYGSLANNPYEKDARIKQFQSQYVLTSKEAGMDYENGMYSGNWLKIGPDFVDEMLDNLRLFVIEFAELMYQEKYDEVWWNSDEVLLKILKENYIDIL